MSLHEALFKTDIFLYAFIDEQMAGGIAEWEIWRTEQKIVEELLQLTKSSAEGWGGIYILLHIMNSLTVHAKWPCGHLCSSS